MPKIFGLEHIIYMCVVLIVAVVSLIFIIKKINDENILKRIIRILAVVLLVMVTINRISVAIKDQNVLHALPSSFCSLSAYILSISLLLGDKNNKVLHFIFYVSFIGGLLTFIYPDFIGQHESVFYIPTISGLVYHSLMLYIDVLIISTKYFTPTFKMAYMLPLGLCVVITFGEFLISALGFADSMYIHNPLLSGSIFTWWFTGILVVVLSYATMFIFDYCLSRKAKKENTENNH